MKTKTISDYLLFDWRTDSPPKRKAWFFFRFAMNKIVYRIVTHNVKRHLQTYPAPFALIDPSISHRFNL